MANRFFFAGPLQLGDVALEGAEAHHLAHVRRFQPGDSVTLFNGGGSEYHAEIMEVGKKRVLLCVLASENPRRELAFPLHVACALPKADRLDFLIEKLTELGVNDFTPLAAVRSAVHPKPATIRKLERAVIEASKQCGRNLLLRIHEPCTVAQWCERTAVYERCWICHPGGSNLSTETPVNGSLAAAVGPEGGFTPDEVAAATHHKFIPVSLGARVLRVETAALALAAWAGLNSCPG